LENKNDLQKLAFAMNLDLNKKVNPGRIKEKTVVNPEQYKVIYNWYYNDFHYFDYSPAKHR